MINNGLLFEDQLQMNLNNKKVKELNPHLKDILGHLYGYLDEEEIIQCEKTENYIKPDIIITYKGVKKFISVKTLGAEQLHRENIDTFINFLECIGISKRTIETILLYQFGDGTIDGTGKERMNYFKLMSKLGPRIEEAKKELNDKENVVRVVFRVMFDGTIIGAEKADAIYIGNCEKGYIATRRNVLKYLKKKSWDKYDAFHIGPLFFRPHARYAETEVKNERFRNQIDLWWSNLEKDICFIYKYYWSYIPPIK